MLKGNRTKESPGNSVAHDEKDQVCSSFVDDNESGHSAMDEEQLDDSQPQHPQPAGGQGVKFCEKFSNHASGEEEHFEQDDSSDQSRKSGGFLGQLRLQHRHKDSH